MHQIYIQDLYLPLHITYISTFKKFHKNTHLKVPGPRYRGGIHRNPSTAEVGAEGWSICDWPELHAQLQPGWATYKNPTSKTGRRTASVAVTSQSRRGPHPTPPPARLSVLVTASETEILGESTCHTSPV